MFKGLELSKETKQCDITLQRIFREKIFCQNTIKTYKGIAIQSQNVFDGLKEGAVITSKKYMSTSHSLRVFKEYGLCGYAYFFGKSGLDLCNIKCYRDSQYSWEEEVLYNKSSKWRVLFTGNYDAVKKFSDRQAGYITVVEEASINKEPLLALALLDRNIKKFK